MRAIVLTGTSPRHHHLVHTLASRLDVVGIWREVKRVAPPPPDHGDADREVLARHFAGRDAAEQRYFGEDATLRAPAGAVVRDMAFGGSNDAAEIARMRDLRADVLVVFGTALLRTEIIDAFDGRLVNLHLGLSPYYRGSGTNVWPLYHREPEYVGATIHYLDRGIDSGRIIAHVRPVIRADDGVHDLGNRTILAAASVVAEIAVRAARGPFCLPSTPQDLSEGRLYLRKAFTADVVRRIGEHIESGMIPEYLADRAARDARVTLIDPPI